MTNIIIVHQSEVVGRGIEPQMEVVQTFILYSFSASGYNTR